MNEHHRSIRSFVRRAGRLTESQQRALETEWPKVGIEFSESELDLTASYGRDAPLVVEIGYGNGDTLVQLATSAEAINFLGIEVHEPGVGHCLIKARDAGISNLRLIAHDAVEVLQQQLPEHSVARLNLYFPDPWPKKRHHKRRILNPDFLTLVHSRLLPGGSLHIATDWANYAEAIDELFASVEQFELAERREHDGDRPLERPVTKFERRGLKRGHKIVDWRFVAK